MQREVAQQVLELVHQAQQPQVGLLHHRLHEAVHGQLGQIVGDTHHQAHHGGAHGIPHGRRQLFPQLKNLLGLPHRGKPRIGERHPAPCGLEQGVAQGAL